MNVYEDDVNIYKEEAEENAKMYKNRMYDINLDETNRNYNNIFLYLTNAEELYNSYFDKNQDIRQNAKTIHGEILINDRLSYYENETQTTLEMWYSIFWYIYYLLIIVLILGVIFDENKRSFFLKISLITFAFFYPFLIPKLVRLKNKYFGVGGLI